MNTNFSKRSSLYQSAFLASSLFLIANTGQASTWTEVGDAGDLLNTAQTPLGEVTNITGTASTTADADLYKIFISTPTTFSAAVTGGDGGDNDFSLALFNANGLGVYANDDATTDNGQPGFPANHELGPKLPGVYYLAVVMEGSGGNFPISGDVSTQDNYIFPIMEDTEIVGPTANGGASPLIGWHSFETPTPLNESYSVALTGVSPVPEPEIISMFLAGLGLLGVLSGRRKRLGIS
ncbi:MAG TPA: PEP-CTERM sorting domain-containing protein [Candidatus Saccharimonadales bacterium]|nr:PEP-CTERM sorting domain-containing protein [Candidatus Saccharimonadales bacterium]